MVWGQDRAENGNVSPGQRGLHGKDRIQSGESQVSRAALVRRAKAKASRSAEKRLHPAG